MVPNSMSRPADILLPNWSCGRPAALDVHVISPLQHQLVGEASFTPGHALQVGVQRKLAAHLSACRSTGTDFIPLVAETLGGLDRVTIRTVKSFGHAIADRSGSLTPPPPPDTSSAGSPSHCGVAMLVCGCIAVQFSPPPWTVLCSHNSLCI